MVAVAVALALQQMPWGSLLWKTPIYNKKKLDEEWEQEEAGQDEEQETEKEAAEERQALSAEASKLKVALWPLLIGGNAIAATVMLVARPAGSPRRT